MLNLFLLKHVQPLCVKTCSTSFLTYVILFVKGEFHFVNFKICTKLDSQGSIVHLPKICFQAHDTEEMSAPICDAGLDRYLKADSAFEVLVH
jgi:hypothetical protein